MAYNPIGPEPFIVNASMASNITSKAFQTIRQDNLVIQCNWTGTPVGNFFVNLSLDHQQTANQDVIVPGTFIQIPLNPQLSAAGAAGSCIFDLNQLGAGYIQLVYVATSGSGTLNAFISSKAV